MLDKKNGDTIWIRDAELVRLDAARLKGETWSDAVKKLLDAYEKK